MKKDQLKNFVEVADCGSINKAAEKLYISQPSLSRSIHALEDGNVTQRHQQKAA